MWVTVAVNNVIIQGFVDESKDENVAGNAKGDLGEVIRRDKWHNGVDARKRRS